MNVKQFLSWILVKGKWQDPGNCQGTYYIGPSIKLVYTIAIALSRNTLRENTDMFGTR